LVRPLTRREPPAPPVLTQLPEFRLIDQDGRPLGSAELKGQVWIAGFFFTSCQTVCPRILAGMDQIADRYRDLDVPIRVVAISVDPETDTPERLREVAARMEPDPQHWTYLTGPTQDVQALVERGFLVAMGQKQLGPGGILDIAHSARLAIVDGQGGVRGFYDTTEEGLDEAFHRARHVLRDQRRAERP
jgi:protein SCO1/2